MSIELFILEKSNFLELSKKVALAKQNEGVSDLCVVPVLVAQALFQLGAALKGDVWCNKQVEGNANLAFTVSFLNGFTGPVLTSSLAKVLLVRESQCRRILDLASSTLFPKEGESSPKVVFKKKTMKS